MRVVEALAVEISDLERGQRHAILSLSLSGEGFGVGFEARLQRVEWTGRLLGLLGSRYTSRYRFVGLLVHVLKPSLLTKWAKRAYFSSQTFKVREINKPV